MDPPLMVTATLDDGLGYGLSLIQRLGQAAGLRVKPLGLMLSPERITHRCQELRPAILGMTVLQFDSETDLTQIRRTIARETKLIAGGPLFGADPDLSRRIGIDHVATDGCAFLKILIDHFSI
jgi:methanogenic corrinoid protein MtbC1